MATQNNLNYANLSRRILASSHPLPDNYYLGDPYQPCNVYGVSDPLIDNLRLIKLPDPATCKMKMRSVIATVTFVNDDVTFSVSLDTFRDWYNFSARVDNSAKKIHLCRVSTYEAANAAGIGTLFRHSTNALLPGVKTALEEKQAAEIIKRQASLRALRAEKKMEMEARKAKQNRK